MSKAKLPKADDWQARDIADWNTTTFRTYLYDRHRELYGLDYVGAVKRDCGMISDMIKKHDKPTVKAFIDECFRQHRPSAQYPGINFWYMYTYRRESVLPKVQMQMRTERLFAQEETPIEKTENSENIDELKGWF